MDVKTRLVALAAAGALGVACWEAPEAVAPPPPEVYVLPVVQKDVPTYLELVGQTRGFQDVEVRARVEGFLERVHFQEGMAVRARRAALRHRPQASRSDRRPDEGRPGDRGSPAGQGRKRRRPLHAARREAGGQPARAGRRPRRPRRGAIAGRGVEGRRREGDARSRLHAHHLADRRDWPARRWSRPATWWAAARARS